jgi:ribonuclease E
LKDALKHDRARIQIGRISHFGLMEMSRQRIRTGVLESSTEICPACGGTGHVRAVSSVALQLLRSIEDQLMKSASHDLVVRTKPDIALYVLNNKRAHLRGLEEHFGAAILIQSDATLAGQQYFAIERGPLARARPTPLPHRIAPDSIAPEHADEIGEESEGAPESEEFSEARRPGPEGGEGGGRRRRRRGRRGRGGRGGGGERHERAPAQNFNGDSAAETFAETEGFVQPEPFEAAAGEHEPRERAGEPGDENGERRRRRRGRRGGRRNRRERFGQQPAEGGEGRPAPGAQEPALHFSAEGFEHPAHFEPEAPHFEPQEQAAAPAPEAPKRRSTVREAAPVVSEESGYTAAPAAPAHTPEPAPAREEETDPNRPRRTGWWSKR